MILASPYTVKELRSRMRGLRAILPMMAFLTVLAVFIFYAFAAFQGQITYLQLVDRGLKLGFTLLNIQVALILLLTPVYAASAVVVEKERETFSVIQTTLLTSWQVVSGITLTSLCYTTLLVFSALPLLSLVFLMGGFGFNHLLWGFLIVIMCAFLTTCLSILVSTIFSRAYKATSATYLFIFFGLFVSFVTPETIAIWNLIRQVASSSFSWDTIPFFFMYTLNPFYMLTALKEGGVTYAPTSGFYVNPLIDAVSQWLSSHNISYIVFHSFVVLIFGLILLFLASYFLFRHSREDNP